MGHGSHNVTNVSSGYYTMQEFHDELTQHTKQ